MRTAVHLRRTSLLIGILMIGCATARPDLPRQSAVAIGEITFGPRVDPGWAATLERMIHGSFRKNIRWKGAVRLLEPHESSMASHRLDVHIVAAEFAESALPEEPVVGIEVSYELWMSGSATLSPLSGTGATRVCSISEGMEGGRSASGTFVDASEYPLDAAIRRKLVQDRVGFFAAAACRELGLITDASLRDSSTVWIGDPMTGHTE